MAALEKTIYIVGHFDRTTVATQDQFYVFTDQPAGLPKNLNLGEVAEKKYDEFCRLLAPTMREKDWWMQMAAEAAEGKKDKVVLQTGDEDPGHGLLKTLREDLVTFSRFSSRS